jgi:hypothetical protein
MYSFFLAYSEMPIGLFSSRSTSTHQCRSLRALRRVPPNQTLRRAQPKPPQIRLVRAECVKDGLEIRSHDERLGDYASICGYPVLLGSERFHWI